jgi:hypothetical protein
MQSLLLALYCVCLMNIQIQTELQPLEPRGFTDLDVLFRTLPGPRLHGFLPGRQQGIDFCFSVLFQGRQPGI